MPKFENMTAEHYPVDTDLPLNNFSHCHIGILHHLDHLSELLKLMGDAEAAKKIAKEALDYFHLGMKAHHLEEELELFPAVLSSAIPGGERTLVAQLIEKLTHEHRGLERAWKELEPSLKEIMKGHANTLDHVHFNLLISRYKAHAGSEETIFLPLAEKNIGPQQQPHGGIRIVIAHAPHTAHSKSHLKC